MKKFPYGKLLAAGLFLFSFFILSFDDVTAYFERLMGDSILAPLAFFTVLILAVVAAPIAALPLIPLASSLFGPFATALISIFGYTVGAIIAFLLAQKVGRPVLRYFLPLEDIEAWERRLPRGVSFWGVVLLRMAVPVDILSYALGLLSALPLKTYTLATFIGVTPFSFIFAYGGAAWSSGSILTLLGIIFAGLVVYIYVWRRLKTLSNNKDTSGEEVREE